MKAILSNCIWLSFVGTLAYGVFFPDSNVLNVSQAFLWIIVVLSLALASLILLVIVAYDFTRDGPERDKMLSTLRQMVRPKQDRTDVDRAIGWAKLIIVVWLIAWQGWIISSVFYCIAAALVWIVNTIGTSKLHQATDPASES